MRTWYAIYADGAIVGRMLLGIYSHEALAREALTALQEIWGADNVRMEVCGAES